VKPAIDSSATRQLPTAPGHPAGDRDDAEPADLRDRAGAGRWEIIDWMKVTRLSMASRISFEAVQNSGLLFRLAPIES